MKKQKTRKTPYRIIVWPARPLKQLRRPQIGNIFLLRDILYLRTFFFSFLLLWYSVPVSSVVSSVGTAFPMKIWWRHDIYVYFISFFVRTATVPGTWLLAYACWGCRIQQSLYACVLHIEPFFPMKFGRVVRTNEQTNRREDHPYMTFNLDGN